MDQVEIWGKKKDPEQQIEILPLVQAAKLVNITDLERDKMTDRIKKRQKQAEYKCVWFTSDRSAGMETNLRAEGPQWGEQHLNHATS